MYRFRPTNYEMKAYPITQVTPLTRITVLRLNASQYPAKCQQAAAIMLMIQNNLDPKVAQYPHELV